MKSTFNRLEKVVFTLSIFCFLLLLIIQGLNYDKNHVINSSSIGNKQNIFSFSKTENNKKGMLILKNIDSKKKEVEVLLNGDPVGNFLESDEIEVIVYNGDVIEVDGTKYNHNLDVKVVGISNNVKFPELNLVLTTSQSIEILGKVQLK